MMAEPLVVLFEDAHCLAVSKPAGLLTQARPGSEPTLEALVRQHLRPDDPGSVYLGTVHRLDKPVSGVVLWAKTAKAARRLADQFLRRATRKEYWAIVEGRPPTDQGVWEDWLCTDTATGLGRVQVVSPHAPRSRHALTRFERKQAAQLRDDWAWLHLWPETGRTHQLRVQSAARGLPILGDRLYGSAQDFGAGIALHAHALTVQHPVNKQPITFTALPPAHWRAENIVLEEPTGQIPPTPR